MTRLLILGFVVLAAGCGQKPEADPVYPVTGRVSFKGQPAAGATVFLHPVDPPGTRVLSAEVQPDGTFAVTTRTKGDGAPPGKYALCLSWTQTVEVNDAEKETPDKFGKKYDDPRRPHSTAEVKAGTNELPPIDIR